MNLFNALIFGLVEGVTEFLPISSTAHLIITSKFLHLTQTEFMKFFEVFIQSGAILAVVFLYFKYVLKNKNIIKNVLISFIPTAIIGLFLHKIIKEVFFESYSLIIFSLFFVGILFLLIEFFISKKKILLNKYLKELSILSTIVVGIAQGLAVVPGVSRAGIVIITMMVMGYRRDEAALYSFLLAVPTIFAASAYDLLKTDINLITNQNNLVFLIMGFITSFFTAYFSVKWFISYLQKKSLLIFGIYRVLTSFILFMV